MFKFWSNIGLIFQILIVVGAVVLLAYFDPFGIFGSKKQKLENTPVDVRSIREIGVLISAEYYGEVLTSLQEALVEEIKESAVNDSKEFEDLIATYQQSIGDFYERRRSIRLGLLRRGDKLYDLFYHDNPILTEHPYYQVFIKVLLEQNFIDKNSERQFLKSLIKMKQTKVDELIEDIGNVPVSDFLVRTDEELEIFTADKKQRKSQIVVLGRGSVKAGIDFGQFTEQNFKYNANTKTIHLVGIKPQILTSDINPWFIPEKQIKGFEIVVMTKKASKPQYMLKVKQRALKKLRQKAIQANIVEHAKKNAERNLQSFFSLLMPDGVDEVVIHDDFLSYFDQSFVTDSITVDVMRSIDSLFVNRYKSDSIDVVGLRDDLRRRKIYLRNGNAYPINRYSARLAMVEDEIISEGDFNWLASEKAKIDESITFLNDSTKEISEIRYLPNRLDSIWNFPDKSTIEAYSEEVDKLYFEKFKWYEVISGDEDYLANEKKKEVALQRMIFLKMMTARLINFENLSADLKENTINVVKDGVTYTLDTTRSQTVSLDEGGHEIRYQPDLIEELGDLEGTIKELIAPDSSIIDIEKLNYANEKIELHWQHDRENVEELIQKMKLDWQLQLTDSIVKVDRFSSWYAFMSGDTLKKELLEAILEERKAMKRAETLLDKGLGKLKLSSIKAANSNLDKAWYYPTEEKLEEFKKKADEKSYGFNKEKKKINYGEVLIQQHILDKKKETFRKWIFNLIEMDFVVEKADGVVVSKEEGLDFIIVR
ncbi:MAG: DUF4230 domain-containing protein [Bacteroidota bacterium]